MDKGWQHTSGNKNSSIRSCTCSHVDPKHAFEIERGLPQAFQWVLGKIWHTCFLMCPAQLFPMLKSKLWASLCHCLNNQVSLLFVFSTLSTSLPSETLSCFTSLLSGSITMSTSEQSPSSSQTESALWKRKGQDTIRHCLHLVLKSKVTWSQVVNMTFYTW